MKKSLITTLVLIMLLSNGFVQSAYAIVYNSLEVQYRTQAEIQQFVLDNPACVDDPVEFAEFPIYTSPQYSGQLSSETLTSAINMTNIQRYIAGLSYDTYLHEPFNRNAQDGSFVTHFNGSLSHYPTKPANVDQAIYDSGYLGTSKSNIGLGYNNINTTIVNGYMEDGDPSNINRVGHRRWILNEFATRFGFGHFSKSNTMYVVDSYPYPTGYTKGIAFPSQNQPIEYFNEYFPWSIAANIDLDAVTHNVRVVLKRLNDGKIWTFSNNQSDGYFNVNNGGYGYSKGYIIFRPNLQDYTINSGDKYQVTVTSTLINFQYNVDFFSLNILPSCKYESENALTKPLISNVISNNASITFGWNSISNAVEYNIYRSDTISGPLVYVGKTTQRTFTDNNIIPNKTYYYYVRAYDSLYNRGVLSDAKPISVQVAKPSNVNISSTFLKNNIQWIYDEVVDGYEIYRSSSQDTGFVKIGETSLNQYSDVYVTAGSTYYYRLRSYRTVNGTKYYSSYTTSLIALTVSPKPELIVARQSDFDAITITWSAVENVTGYKVELYDIHTSKFQNIGTTNKLTHIQSGLSFNNSYTFRVTPYLTLSNSTVYGSAASVVISIPEKPVSSISIEKLPLKTSYILGEDLNVAGATLKVNFNDSTSTLFTISSGMTSGFDPYASLYGPQTVTVTYGGKTTSFQVSLDRFSDVPYGHRNYVHINALVGLGIINGYSDNTFRPNNTLTRAQAAIMIVRAARISTEGVSSSFTDVPPTHAAYKFISAAYQTGIINGYSDGTFRPNANVTRAQIAIMIQRAFSVQSSENIITFTDVPEGYAPKKFIETLASQKIVNGYSDGTFRPLNNVTRAQFSTMIYNAIQYEGSQP